MKTASSVSSQYYTVLPEGFFRSSLKGSMMGATARNGATWLTRPNHDRMSVRDGLAGIEKSVMHLIRSWLGLYSSQPRRYPAKVTFLLQKLNLSGLKGHAVVKEVIGVPESF